MDSTKLSLFRKPVKTLYGKVFFLEDPEGNKRCRKMSMLNHPTMFSSCDDPEREIDMLIRCQKIGGVPKYIWSKKVNSNTVVLDTEYCEKGDLFEKTVEVVAEDKRGRALVDTYAKNIALVVEQFHKHNLAHLDLSLENVFIKKDNSVVIGDLSVMVDKCNTRQPVSPFTGKPAYRPPELKGYSECNVVPSKLDVWCFGVMVFIMAVGCGPYDTPEDKRFRRLIKVGPRKLYKGVELDEDIWQVLDLALEPDPDKRPSMSEILKCDLFSKKAHATP